ncbi:hypothetical protein PVK06_017456 [Gossypium arboreum]|uniref:UBN2 domain-containing protein n=1 Tax=Gossypium arboreum TaxID=29729 RepID=A0ABR0Q2P7_GOSAR|nr:hypothetical protein PVK06_017456 [Gossypium arboreum]
MLFKTKLDESIKKVSECFVNIINGRKAIRKTYANKEMVKKILNRIPKSWKAKMTNIEESKDLDILSLNKAIGSFLTYELKINHSAQETKEASKKVGVTFKSTTHEKYESSNDDDEEKDEEEEKMALFVRKFKKLNKAKRPSRRHIIKNPHHLL